MTHAIAMHPLSTKFMAWLLAVTLLFSAMLPFALKSGSAGEMVPYRQLLSQPEKTLMAGLLLLALLTETACPLKNIGAYISLGAQFAIQAVNLAVILRGGPGITPALAALITGWAAKASDLWSHINTIWQAYQANKSQGTLAALTAAIQEAQKELPQIVPDVGVLGQAVIARIEAATTSLLSVIASIAAFYNVHTPAAVMLSTGRSISPRSASVGDLKKQWNSQVAQADTGLLVN